MGGTVGRAGVRVLGQPLAGFQKLLLRHPVCLRTWRLCDPFLGKAAPPWRGSPLPSCRAGVCPRTGWCRPSAHAQGCGSRQARAHRGLGSFWSPGRRLGCWCRSSARQWAGHIKDTPLSPVTTDLDILGMAAPSPSWLLVGRGRGAADRCPLHETVLQQGILWPKCQRDQEMSQPASDTPSVTAPSPYTACVFVYFTCVFTFLEIKHYTPKMLHIFSHLQY